MVFILMKYALKRDFTPNFLIYIYIYKSIIYPVIIIDIGCGSFQIQGTHSNIINGAAGLNC